MKKVKRAWVLLAVISMMVISACGSGTTATTSTSSASASEAGKAAGGDKELKVRFFDNPAGFDPATIFRIENENIAFNVFSGLTTYDGQTGELIPDLAESWETSDNKTWTFHLRKGVQWQSGYGEFTAADVLYSYNRIMDPATASTYASEFADVVKMEAPDDYTVVIELSKPNGNFLHVVANYHQGQIVKKEAIEAGGDQVKFKPVGTGPYYVEKIDVNSEIVLVRHEEYFRGPAPIKKITFPIIKNESNATIALQNGEIDVIMRSNREEELAVLEKAGFKMNATMNTMTYIMMLNTKNQYLSDIRVRHAIAHALDYPAISAALSPKNATSPAYNIVPDWMNIYTDKVPQYKYDPEKAKALLAEAGYADGINVTLLIGAVNEEYQLVQEYLKAVGINMEFEVVDAPTYNQRRLKGEFDISIRAIPALNPDMLLFSYLHPDNIAPAGLNSSSYNNPELAEKLEAAKVEVDETKRQKLYEEVQIIAMEDLPYYPMFGINYYWPSKQNVTGIHINKLSQVNFYDVDVN